MLEAYIFILFMINVQVLTEENNVQHSFDKWILRLVKQL